MIYLLNADHGMYALYNILSTCITIYIINADLI